MSCHRFSGGVSWNTYALKAAWSIAGDIPLLFQQLQNLFVFPFTQLRIQQIAVIEHVLNGKDTFGIFPTGFGKTMMFTLTLTVLVISPLKSLMTNQCMYLQAMGISVATVSKKSDMAEEVIEVYFIH